MSFTIGETIIRALNSLDQGATSRYSATQPDPTCLYIEPRSRLAG